MSSSYEFWLTDDAGQRLLLLKDLAYVNYIRSTVGYGTFQFGVPYDSFVSKMATVFQPDWRVDVYRSPATGVPKRREASYLLRKFRVYDRETDHIRVIQYWGRSPLDILRRQTVTATLLNFYNKTDFIDDMMKEIVTENFIGSSGIPAGEFSVDGDTSQGPSVNFSFKGRVVLDVLKDLKAMSLSLNFNDPTKHKIYFDVVEGPGKPGGFGYVFRTYTDLRGIDRTAGIIFSVENGNLSLPDYSEDYLDESTLATVGDSFFVLNKNEYYLSRWNAIEQYQSSSNDYSVDQAKAQQMLADGAAKKIFSATFLNTPGSSSQPRSLYGVDWDLGDLLPCQYAGISLNAEVAIVYVALNDKGEETLTGSNLVGVG